MSLRKAINAKCRECTVDPSDHGTAAQQIACCTSRDCALHPVRPITCKVIPSRLLTQFGLLPESLDERARYLIQTDRVSVGGQNDPLLSKDERYV